MPKDEKLQINFFKKMINQGRAVYQKEYREKYGDLMREQIKEWFMNHPRYLKNYCKRWRHLNPQYYKIWQQKHYDHYIEYQKQWRDKNREKINAYMKDYMHQYRNGKYVKN